MKQPLIILTGPTAVGKTSLSIRLAKALNGEIISADSMQIYKYMDIGTAKIKTEEMQGIKHHLIDELMPDDEFNVVRFQKMAKEALKDIDQRGKIPIVVGGTGFYIQALLNDIDFSEMEINTKYRDELNAIANEKGPEYLHNMLKNVDLVSANKIHANNVKRIIRALEFFKETGTPISEHNEEQAAKQSPYNFLYLVLNQDRKILYDRIDSRVDQMITEGLVNEVEHLLSMGYSKELVSMQGLGYKEIIPYLEGETTLEDAVYILKRDTRHFAKRQLTWFRREKSVTFIDKQNENDDDKILEHILEILKERGFTWKLQH